VTAATARERFALLQVPGVRIGALPAEPVRRLPSGIAALDALLGGGLPRGYLSEIVGGPSSGRTALLHALLASATRRGEVAAVVDLGNALDPPSLARAGADLERVLWVRPPSPRCALKCAELVLSAGGFGLIALDLGAPALRPGPGQARPLPRQVWQRLAQVTRRAGAVLAVLAERRMTTSCAAVALRLTRRRARWSGRLFDGITSTAELARSRFGPAERTVVLALGEQLAAIDGVRVERWPGGWGGGGEAAAGHTITR
jgi:hypothetical protein